MLVGALARPCLVRGERGRNGSRVVLDDQGPGPYPLHDDRSALVCALTALCLVSDDFVAVGDEEDGWIVLPPPTLVRPWAMELLERE